MQAFGDYALPIELHIRIFEFLPLADLQKARLVCKYWELVVDMRSINQNSTLRLTPSNSAMVLAKLKEVPLALKLRMQDLRIVDMKNSSELVTIFELAGSYIRRLELIASPIYRSIGRHLFNLEALHLSRMPHVPEIIEIAAIDLSYFPRLKTLLLDCSLSHSLRLRMLTLLAHPARSSAGLEHLRFQFNTEEQDLVTNMLGTYATTLKNLELSYFSHKPLEVTRWELLFRKLTKLESLHLTGGYKSEWLYSIFVAQKITTPLKYVDLTGSCDLEDKTLRLIMKKWPNALRQLNLMFCSKITDASIDHLTLQGNLRVLNLSQCPTITGQGLLRGIGTGRKLQLRELYLNDANNIDQASFCMLAQRLPQLELLCVSSCTSAITDQALASIFRYMTALKALDLDHCYRISDEGLHGVDGHSIHKLRSLRTLSLRGCRHITDATLINALRLGELRTLKLGYCHRISVSGIEGLVRNCPKLENLIVSSCLMLNDDAIRHIATGLKQLRFLNLSNCDNLTERAIDYIEEHCENLVKLSISGIESYNVGAGTQRLWEVNPQLEISHAKVAACLKSGLKNNRY